MAAPCKIELVAQKMGLTPSSKKKNEWRFGNKGSLALDLKNDYFYDHEQKVGGGVFQFVVHNGAAANEREAAQYLKDCGLLPEQMDSDSKTLTELRHHIYVDETSHWLRKASRLSNGSWRQHRWENEQWKPKVQGIRNVPYGLDRLNEDTSDKICFVFEGEKDVERAWRNGLLATCNVGGAGKWLDDLNQSLTGRTVCIVPDNDVAGENHATKVHASLRKSGIDCFILWNYQDDLPPKGDFSDWMDTHNNRIDEFLSLAQIVAAEPRQVETQFLNKFRIMDASELAAMEFPPLTFLCDKILPSVGLAMLAGPPKAGKSWQALGMAKEMINQGHKVYYIAAEDNERRLKDRINQVFFQPPSQLKFHAGLSQDYPIPRGDDALTYLREVHASIRPSCIIIDTVASVLNPTASNKNYDVTVGEYEALRKLASELKIAILVVHHTKKKSEVSQSPLEQVLGSTGITATVETIMVMENVVGSKDRKLHLTGKDVEQDEFYLRWNGHGYDFEEDAAQASLGPTQKEVLQYIKQKPRCTQKGVVVGLGKDQGQISKILDHLIECDLAIKIGEGYTAK